MAAARSQQYAAFEHLSRKHGIACSPPEGVTVEAIVMVIGNIIGFEKVRAASRMNKRVIIFVSDEAFVAPIVEQGLALDSGTFVMAYPLDSCAQKVVISNLPPFLKNDLILSALQRYGDCVSPLIMLPVGFKDKRVSHVMSFRRQVFMVLKKEYASLNVTMKFTSNGHNYQVYVSTDTLKCFGCGAIGHMKQFCPLSQKQPPLNAPNHDFQTNTITFTRNDYPPPNVTDSVGNDPLPNITNTVHKVSASNVTDSAYKDPLPNVTDSVGDDPCPNINITNSVNNVELQSNVAASLSTNKQDRPLVIERVDTSTCKEQMDTTNEGFITVSKVKKRKSVVRNVSPSGKRPTNTSINGTEISLSNQFALLEEEEKSDVLLNNNIKYDGVDTKSLISKDCIPDPIECTASQKGASPHDVEQCYECHDNAKTPTRTDKTGTPTVPDESEVPGQIDETSLPRTVTPVKINTPDVQIDCNLEVAVPVTSNQVAAEEQQGFVADSMGGYESDGTSSSVSVSSDAGSDTSSLKLEDASSISPDTIHTFLHKSFRKKNVKIKDNFPVLEDFIQVTRIMISRPDRYNLTDPQRHRLRKFLSRARNELKNNG